ncbi:OPT oligopeptide transporter protein-domain-containing protein [Schizophyllum amplum]|uniref:OPT oligopeptide transporter protein-domain-containing protein n=1 Tax=Schizophyllum amplum TaxID=97359 RepID=A0A550CDD1_9AGAR|nr:OPT oligopeptide transporter protein-domain-containing protein [Auriculariopsis ampla]
MPAEDFTYEMRHSAQYVLPGHARVDPLPEEEKEEPHARVDPYDSSSFTESPASYAPRYNLWGEPIDGDSLERQKTNDSQYPDDYEDDPNFEHDIEGWEDDSPYPEVRSAVSNTDDQDMPASTLRAWIIGIAWAVVIPGLNQFLAFRFPSIIIGGVVSQLLSLPIGCAFARYLPNWSIFGLSLNPGPFSVKEHVLITVRSSVGAQSAYATEVVAVQRIFYNQSFSFSYQWLLIISTQLIGLSVGGVAKRFLVSPPSMIWPDSLVTCALFNTLHSARYSGIGNMGGMSRERFFIYAFLASFVWYFFPGYLFTALSYFSWVTWIKPDDPGEFDAVLYFHGLGLTVVTFDWNQIAYMGSPLATPWWAQVNIIAGFVTFFWIITPALYFTNTWYAQYMPLSSSTSWDNTGQEYDLTRILTGDTALNVTEYHAYSPLFISSSFALGYGVSFASISATVVHSLLYFRKPIQKQFQRSLNEQPDIHARLMAKYPVLPDWWFIVILAVTFTFGVVCIEVWPTELPVWGFIVALVLSFAFVVPIGMIQAVTNHQVSLGIISELIVGYMLPGRPVAMMLFKTYGYIAMSEALTFTSNFKLGHYMKPPRPMFCAQLVATAVAGTTQLGVQEWLFTNVPFTCPDTQVFGTASIIWGVIGPGLQFSAGHLAMLASSTESNLFSTLMYFFLIGAVCPVIPWLITKKYPSSWAKYVNPLICSSVDYIPPAGAINYVPWAIVGFFFQFIIRRRYFSWWTKYNYVFSAALDAGTSISVVVIFFALQFPMDGTLGLNTIQAWWGNSVPYEGADYVGVPMKTVAPGDTFG